MKYYHPYHLVTSSPWPFFSSLILFLLASSSILYFNAYITSTLFYISFLCILLVLFLWWKNIITEGTYLGSHTLKVQTSLTLGFYLFLFSEVLIFSSLFFVLFYSRFSLNISYGSVWPPIGITLPDPFSLPLFNTFLLLLSGFFITWSHHALFARSKSQVLLSLTLTILCGILFTFLQLFEYYTSSFTLTDGIYGSIFYLLTSLHGLHVCIGTLFFLVCLLRFFLSHFSQYHSLGFNFSIFYWHFVDVVWLFVWLFLYLL